MSPIVTPRLDFLDAYTEWDDAWERVRIIGRRPTAATLRRETDRKEAAAKKYAASIGLTTNEMLGLFAALRRIGWELPRALDAIETIAATR